MKYPSVTGMNMMKATQSSSIFQLYFINEPMTLVQVNKKGKLIKDSNQSTQTSERMDGKNTAA